DGLGDHAGEERGAVLARDLPLDVELAARREHRHGDLAEREVAFLRGIKHLARLADQLVGAPSEHLGEARIAQEEAALAREGDADGKIGEQRLVLELRVARAPGVARRRLLDLQATRGQGLVHGRALARWSFRSVRVPTRFSWRPHGAHPALERCPSPLRGPGNRTLKYPLPEALDGDVPRRPAQVLSPAPLGEPRLGVRVPG